jgi:hypothetical protein
MFWFLLLWGSVSGQGMDMGCVLLHCPLSFAKASLDPVFMKGTQCQLGCNDVYKHDTTPEKLVYQNCTTKCALTYESPAGDAFTNCAMLNDCISFPPIDVTCPKPEVDPTLSLADLSGEWWQQWGKNALWDCYPCQHIHDMKLVNDSQFCEQTVGPNGPVQAPCWSYTYSYDLYTETGTQYFQQTWQLPHVDRGRPVDIFYEYMGSTHNETWYLLKATDRYLVLVDCSYMMTWTNVGSILWVRPEVVLTDKEMADIAVVYKEKLGWSFPEEFCNDRHGRDSCTEPTGQFRQRRPNFLPAAWN